MATAEEEGDVKKLQKTVGWAAFNQLLMSLLPPTKHPATSSTNKKINNNLLISNNRADLEILSFCISSLHENSPVTRTQSNSFASEYRIRKIDLYDT